MRSIFMLPKTAALKIAALLCLGMGLFSCQDAVRLRLSERVNILVKDTILYDHLWLDYDGISIYADALQKQRATPEFKLYYQEVETFKAMWEVYSDEEMLEFYNAKGVDFFPPSVADKVAGTMRIEEGENPGSSLSGMRIAIDPVHIGGSYRMAKMEDKLLQILRAPGDTLFIDEGAMSLAVARILEAKLKKMGASVHLSRTKPGVSALGKNFFDWLQKDFKAAVERDRYIKAITPEEATYLLEKADPQYIYNQYFKNKEMRARAQGINAFRPDATVIIQFNVHEPNWERRDARGVMRPTDKNYAMAFVPGGFMANELATPMQRLQFLRLLVTDHLDESVKLSKQAIIAFRYQLGTLPVAPKNKLKYLQETTNFLEAGIYARNLSMTRLVHGPICYGEPLCIDNLEEAEALLKKEAKVGDDIITSLRAEAVADAYITALEEYLLRGQVPITEDDIIEEEL